MLTTSKLLGHNFDVFLLCISINVCRLRTLDSRHSSHFAPASLKRLAHSSGSHSSALNIGANSGYLHTCTHVHNLVSFVQGIALATILCMYQRSLVANPNILEKATGEIMSMCGLKDSREVGSSARKFIWLNSRAAIDSIVKLHVVCCSIHETFPVPLILKCRYARGEQH